MTTEDVFLESSEIFRESPCRGIGGNVAKKLKRKRYFLWFFQSIFCFIFLCNFFDLYAFTTFTNKTITSSHLSHTITPVSNHHTKIIPKLIELRTYVSKIVWFRYDYGMMVWKWYDWMIVVWWFVRCVCEWRITNSCEQSTHTFFSFSSNSEIPHKALFKFSVFATFSYQEMTRQYPEDLWRPGH